MQKIVGFHQFPAHSRTNLPPFAILSPLRLARMAGKGPGRLMAQMRAAVSIDSGHCTVRNAWLERSWAPFPGHTLGLTDARTETDWIASPGPDLALKFDGDLFGLADFSDIHWSEERNALGAALVCKRTWPGAAVVTRDLAYDAHPAIQRFVSVISLMTRPAELRAPILDALYIDRAQTTVHWDGFNQQGEAYAGDTEERGVALHRQGQGGLIIGAYGGAVYDYFHTDEARCTLGSPLQHLVEPGSVTKLPPTYILAYTGDLSDVSRSVYADFLAQMRKEHKARQKGQGEPYD